MKKKTAPAGLVFTCPECGGNRLKEIMSSITRHTPIARIDAQGDHDYDYVNEEQGYDEDTAPNYSCAECGFMLRGADECLINECADLAEWVKAQMKAKK